MNNGRYSQSNILDIGVEMVNGKFNSFLLITEEVIAFCYQGSIQWEIKTQDLVNVKIEGNTIIFATEKSKEVQIALFELEKTANEVLEKIRNLFF